MIDRLEWTPSPPPLAAALAARALFDSEDPAALGNTEVTGRMADLPFYPSLDLYHMELKPVAGPQQHLFMLAHDRSVYVLDGTSLPVHDANQSEGIAVTEETVADYLRFFCFAVRGDDGPFVLYEAPATTPEAGEHAAGIAGMAAPLTPDGRDDDGSFRVRACVSYGSVLFSTVFTVSETGHTMMVEDTPLADNVPASLLPKLPDLAPPAVIAGRLASAGAVQLTGAAILRMLVEVLLETALGKQSATRLLVHFNARQAQGSALEHFARLVTKTAPVVCIESAIPFVEESVAQIVAERIGGQAQPRVIRPAVDVNDDTRLRLSLPATGPGIVLLPFHSYRSVMDAERVAHELAAHELGCLIGCEQVGDLPASLRQVIDLTLRLPRVDPDLFEVLFRRVLLTDPPVDWRDTDTHWVTHVHHSDFQQPYGLSLTPEEAIAYVRERALQRLRDVEPVEGLGLRQLHGLGEARAFAEDLITDIHEAIAGRLDWQHVDRGVLLVGAPGTGKTTLARAIAKDCGIRFVNASAASWQAAGHLGDHIRAMRADFALARRFAPAILFIDEIDSIGSRDTFSGQNAQYSTQVVNALLEQLQGIDERAPLIVMAATNEQERVDPALRRAGRLDRDIEIPRPNTEALALIYRHYLDRYAAGAYAPDVDVDELGGLSLGRTGADVELYVRGAARRARRSVRQIRQADLLAEITSKPRDADSSPRMTPDELRRVAVHEAGHALASYLTHSRGEQIGFVSVVPRAGGALGFVANLATNRVLLSRTEYLERLEVVLAGRAAEEVVYGEQGVSGGAGGSGRHSDLAVATAGAIQLVTQQGLGPEHDLFWSDTADEPQIRQAQEILRATYKSVLTKIWQHGEALQRLTEALVEHQELSGDEVRRLLGAIPDTITVEMVPAAMAGAPIDIP